MIRDRKKPYPVKSGRTNGSRKDVKHGSPGPAGPLTSPKLINLRRGHTLTARTISLSAKLLASRVGYLTVEALPTLGTLGGLPTRSFPPGELIPCNEALCLIKDGWVQIRHSQHKYPVKRINAGVLFGEMPLLGQSMLVTEAAAGDSGATISTMSVASINEWVDVDPRSVVELIGPRLVLAEREHFRCQFQLHDSMVAEILMRLANGGKTIEGITQEGLADRIGIYRETVNVVLNELKSVGLIEIHNKAITILDTNALRDLSEL